MRLAVRGLILFTTALLLIGGCGYHTVGTGTKIPASVHTIAVPIFLNKTQFPRTELVMTAAVTRELTGRTHYKVLPKENSADADAVLKATVLTEVVAPLTYDSTTGRSSSYLVTVTAKVILADRENRVLYENDNYLFRQQYQSTQELSSFIEEDSPATDRLARDFAQALVGDMLESF